MSSARALQFVAPRRVALTELDLPPLGDGDVLVRTRCSGLSAGTELLAYRGQIDPDLPLDESIGALAGTFRFPFRFGYSCAGVVEDSRAALGRGQRVEHDEARIVDPAVPVGKTVNEIRFQRPARRIAA